MKSQEEVREYVNLEFTKTILKLDKEHFMQLEDFINDLNKLMNTRSIIPNNFVKTCKIMLLDKEVVISPKKRKLYKRFIQKYSFLLEYFFNTRFPILPFNSSFYRYLKENYDQKDNFMAAIEKLCELELDLLDIEFIPNGNFDGNYDFETSTNEKTGVITDGKITWFPQTSTDYYSIYIENANYILEYKKRYYSKTSLKWLNGTNVTMKFKNLSFDIASLPSYAMLYDFSVDVPIGFKTAKQKTDVVNKIKLLNSARRETKILLSALQSLTQRLEYCEDREERKAIISKIEEIKQLYNFIETLEPMLNDGTKSQSGMGKKEVQKTLHNKKWGVHC